jgi:hypothetical protein
MGASKDRVPAWMKPVLQLDRQFTESFITGVKSVQKELKMSESTLHKILMGFEVRYHLS